MRFKNIKNKMISLNGLKIDENLFSFINQEVIPDTNINIDDFSKDFSILIQNLSPINKKLLLKRENIQSQLNQWHDQNRGADVSFEKYKKFLFDIGYIVEEGDDFLIETKNVDTEIADIS